MNEYEVFINNYSVSVFYFCRSLKLFLDVLSKTQKFWNYKFSINQKISSFHYFLSFSFDLLLSIILILIFLNFIFNFFYMFKEKFVKFYLILKNPKRERKSKNHLNFKNSGLMIFALKTCNHIIWNSTSSMI